MLLRHAPATLEFLFLTQTTTAMKTPDITKPLGLADSLMSIFGFRRVEEPPTADFYRWKIAELKRELNAERGWKTRYKRELDALKKELGR